jgi:hypothetical protein
VGAQPPSPRRFHDDIATMVELAEAVVVAYAVSRSFVFGEPMLCRINVFCIFADSNKE